MAAQVFPCIISALWSAGDLFSSIYGVTSLKPKVEFIQPCFSLPFLFDYISEGFFFLCFKVFLAFGVEGLHSCHKQVLFCCSALPNKGSFSRDFKCLCAGLFQNTPRGSRGAAVLWALLEGWS